MSDISKPERVRLEEIKDGRLYPRSVKTGTTQRLVDRGLAEWLEHATTGHVFAHITDKGRVFLAA